MNLKKLTLPLLCVTLCFPGTSLSLELDLGDGIDGSLDSTLSIGAAMRTEDRDDRLIGRANGGTLNSINYDNGNLNYDKGDLVSAPVKLTQELRLNPTEQGNLSLSAFARWSAFYDFVIMDEDTEFQPLGEAAENNLGHDVRLLDAYVDFDFDVGDTPVLVRAGNIVLNWGESTFIQNGLNTINPFDISKLRLAGSELKEGFVPMAMVDARFDLTDLLSAEAFYQFEWDNTTIEPEGTFFSVNDFASPGGDSVFLGFGAPPPLGPPDNSAVIGTGANPPIGVGVGRSPDREADDQGQFGIALRYLAEQFNDTEFGLYWTRLHSRLPLLSARTGTPAGIAAGDFAGSAEYFREFPEDIDTLGLSFNTVLPGSGVQLQGEFSYRIDAPLQIDEVEILYTALSPLRPEVFGMSQLGSVNPGDYIQGYREKDVLQWLTSASQVYPNVLGANSASLVGEVGATYVRDMESEDELRYNGPGTDTSANPFFTAAMIQPETQSGGFADDFSWGYRVLGRLQYDNAIGSVGLSPSVAFSHDVTGTTPGPGGAFVEDRKAVTAKIGATFLNDLKTELSYTTYFDAGEFNQLLDRDFVALSASYSF